MDRVVKHTPADTKPAPGYDQTRARVEDYFDRSATKTWERLTSDAPVSRIRETVRKGRDQMRALMLSRLPDDLRGARILDAGCGPGMATIELAKRGATVEAWPVKVRYITLTHSIPEPNALALETPLGTILHTGDWNIGYV